MSCNVGFNDEQVSAVVSQTPNHVTAAFVRLRAIPPLIVSQRETTNLGGISRGTRQSKWLQKWHARQG
jgi:hypothetical protein